MKFNRTLIFGTLAVGLLSVACTGRRTASEPEPDGDTIEVSIHPELFDPASQQPDTFSLEGIEYIEINE